MEFAVDLVKSFGRNDRITDLLRQARVVVVPVVNVDGFNLSRTDGEFVDLRALDEYDPTGLGSVFNVACAYAMTSSASRRPQSSQSNPKGRRLVGATKCPQSFAR